MPRMLVMPTVSPVPLMRFPVPGVLPMPRSLLQYYVRSVRMLLVRRMSTMSGLPSA